MAERPVFVSDEKMYVKTVATEFTFCPGFAKAQKERSAANLHAAFLSRYPDARVLEISSFSKEELGRSLSAFHLTVCLKDGRRVPVETAYQAGKIFRDGGPFTDLLDAAPSQAKRDPRLSQHGPITSFTFEGMPFPTEPSTIILHMALHESAERASRTFGCIDGVHRFHGYCLQSCEVDQLPGKIRGVLCFAPEKGRNRKSPAGPVVPAGRVETVYSTLFPAV